jgi:hypothetical protein
MDVNPGQWTETTNTNIHCFFHAETYSSGLRTSYSSEWFIQQSSIEINDSGKRQFR